MSCVAIGFALSLATGSLFGLVCDVYGALAFVVAVVFLIFARQRPRSPIVVALFLC